LFQGFECLAEPAQSGKYEQASELGLCVTVPYNKECKVITECEMTDSARDSRLELRVARRDKGAIDRADALNGSTTTYFMRSTMLAASEQAVRAGGANPVKEAEEVA
jgi:hypothetical protein